MSKTVTSSVRRVSDRFEPDLVSDPVEARKLRGHLEAIDYTVAAANQAVLAQALDAVSDKEFQSLALTAAKARGAWVNAARKAAGQHQTPSPEEVENLAHLRSAYEELSLVYDAMRRMVERGYLKFQKSV